MVLSKIPIPITAIILTYNEAVNITKCLACLRRVDEVIVVDSGSADETLDVVSATRPNARIVSHEFEDFGRQRNWALDHAGARNQWVLFVDADEYCTPELLDEIYDFVQDPNEYVGGYIAGKNYFLGRWLKHSTMYPSYQLRLLKVGEVRYQKEGHGQREVTDRRVYYLREGWRHEAFSKGVYQWISRHNQYSSDESELIRRLRESPLSWSGLISVDPITRRRGLKHLGAKLPFRPLIRFLYVYLLKKGFLDGYPGFLYCLLRVAQDIHIVTKIAEEKYSRERCEESF